MHRNITFKRMILDAYQFMRAQKPVTRFLGAQHSRSQHDVEIDVTYRCNLRCKNCNRSCTQAPSDADIAVEKIELFLQESITKGIKWKRIRLLGGEPTLHPEFSLILDRLLTYKRTNRPDLRIVVCTNGAGRRVRQILVALPDDVIVKTTAKGGRQRLFRPFNMAPIDSVCYRLADYTAGCRIISDCGLGLTPSGYYPCAVAGGIDRVFGFNLGRTHLPDHSDDMRDQMEVFCRFCGHFGFLWPTRRQKTSPSWQNAYQRFQLRSKGGADTK